MKNKINKFSILFCLVSVIIFVSISLTTSSPLRLRNDDGTEYQITEDGDFKLIGAGLEIQATNKNPATGDLRLKINDSTEMWFSIADKKAYIKGDLPENTGSFPSGFTFTQQDSGTQAVLTSDGDLYLKGYGPKTTTYYFNSMSGEELAVYNTSGEKEYNNLYGSDLLGRETPSDGNIYYYLKDHLGSTRAVVYEKQVSPGNYTIDLAEAIEYNAYGVASYLLSSTGDKTKETFTGKEYDTEGATDYTSYGIGEYYFGARMYDPELAIWMTTDPAGQYFNPYNYCAGDPVNFIDPTGMEGEEDDHSGKVWMVNPETGEDIWVSVDQVDDLLQTGYVVYRSGITGTKEDPTGLKALGNILTANAIAPSTQTGVSFLVGAGFSLAAPTGFEGSAGLAWNPWTKEAGGFASGGISTGLNISADVFGGFVLGGYSNVAGKTMNININITVVSVSVFTDPRSSKFLGMTVGAGPGLPIPVSGSVSMAQTVSTPGYGYGSQNRVGYVQRIP